MCLTAASWCFHHVSDEHFKRTLDHRSTASLPNCCVQLDVSLMEVWGAAGCSVAAALTSVRPWNRKVERFSQSSEALIVFITLHKHFVCSAAEQKPAPLPRNHGWQWAEQLSERLWMTWIINSVVVLQLYWDLCDVIFMSSSLICCWMSVWRASAGGRIHLLLDWTAECCCEASAQSNLFPTSTCWAWTAVYGEITSLSSGQRRLMISLGEDRFMKKQQNKTFNGVPARINGF